MKYREEIDALRAMAISSVVFFHFWPTLFKNGYLGVDIFFVISGFLITYYIYESILNKKFSLKNFYLRRIKRILPISLFVIITVLVISQLILIGHDYKKFLQSLIASLTFTSNIYFWRDGGYFSQADSLKPLLHFWSLSVEEQFYLFFPIIIILIFKLTKSIKFHILIVGFITLLSFISFYYLHHIGLTNPAFFITPFRVWQFGIGSIAALVYFYHKRKHTTFSLLFSVTSIVLGIIYFSAFTATVFVTFGTALFLSMNYRKIATLNLFFESKYIRYLGLISFSTYLWHWPLLVFMGYVSIGKPDNAHLIGIFVLTYLLSIISYHYIEQPFRHIIKTKVVVIISFLIVILLLFLAILSLKYNFFQNDKSFSEKIASSIQTNYRCNFSDYIPYGSSRACWLNSRANKDYSIALVGNSHAQMYAPAIKDYLHDMNKQGLIVPLNGCLPTIQFNVSMDCLRLAKINLNKILNDEKITTVVIGMTWSHEFLVDYSASTIMDPNKINLLSAIIDLITKLENNGKKVYLIGPLMIPGYDIPSELSRKIKFYGLDYETTKDYLKIDRSKFDFEFKTIINNLKEALGERFILPSDIFCNSYNCYFGDSEGVYFSDSNHLSSYGVSKLKKLFGIIFTN